MSMTSRNPARPRTIYLVRAAEAAVRTLADAALKDAGVTLAQYTVLSLAQARGTLSSADLARRLRMTPQSMNEVVVKAERLDLIERRPAPGDRRELLISLTDHGRQVLTRCDTIVDGVEARLFAAVDPPLLHDLRRGLSLVTAAERDPQPV